MSALAMSFGKPLNGWLMPALLTLVCLGQAGVAGATGSDSNTTPGHVSFRNEVMAVLAKAGCNAGTCHGNKNGKGGFKLSLRGQDPEADFISLTREGFARRIDAVQPAQSLILLKGSGGIAHEGGLRFKQESDEYQLLHRWIAGGTLNDVTAAPRLEGLEVEPGRAVVNEPVHELQIRVLARFSDGTRRDVTSRAVYEAASRVVKVSAAGLVQRQQWGESSVNVRFLDRQDTVRLAFVPERPGFRFQAPSPVNYIDEQVFAKLRELRVNPSPVASDEVFIRRAHLDLLGLVPTAQEARAFVASRSRNKRARLIEQLLERPEFADFWALKWADLLRVEAHSLDQKGVQSFHGWIRHSIAGNKPLDQFVRELITARGSTYSSPAANYYRANRDALTRGKAAAQVFLGTRLQCAECHNHPSDRWTQDDYYDWASVFAGVRYKVVENKREIGSDEHEWNGEQIVFLSREGTLKNPRTGTNAQPRFLGAAVDVSNQFAAARQRGSREAARSADPLEALASWLTSPQHPLFARVQANRIWSHLMGRGLVDPPDDFRATNPASHPELLDLLAADFVRNRFDVRHLIRRIMNSRTYQLSSEPNESNASDEVNYSHVQVRRLSAEQLLDCQSQVTAVPLRFAGHPAGLRAAQLPGVRPESKGKRRASQSDQFLELFGKPPRLLTTDTERSCECNMGQAFQLISGPTIQEMLSEKNNAVAALLTSPGSARERLEEFFWRVLTRPPTPEEFAELVPELDNAANPRAAWEDVLWGLLNSKDFVFRR